MQNTETEDRCPMWCRYNEKAYYRSSRVKGAGSGNVMEMKVTKLGIEVTGWGKDVDFLFDGERWFNQGKCCRDHVETKLQVGPGYVDAVENMSKYLSLEKVRAEKHSQKMQDGYIEMRKELEERYCHGRHPTLEAWRNRNPADPDKIPACLEGIRHVKRVEVSQPCHVYFLLKDGVVVYVGQTSGSWPARIDTHAKEGLKEFDDAWFLETDFLSLNDTERKYIDEFQPKYNVVGKKGSE